MNNYVAFWVDDDGMIGPIVGCETKPEGVEYCKKHAAPFFGEFSEEQIAELYEQEETPGPGHFTYYVRTVERNNS